MVKDIYEMKFEKYGMYNEFEMLPYLVENELVHFIIYGAGKSVVV